MRNERIASAIRNEADRQRAARKGPSVSVEGTVRAHLKDILAVRPETTWDGIAKALAAEGVVWANGNPLTGKQLRSIVSRLTKNERMTREGGHTPRIPDTSPPALASEPLEKNKEDTQETVAKPAEKSSKLKILSEIQRASSERK